MNAQTVTAKVIQESIDRPLHRRSASELVGVKISHRSEWYSRIWYFDNPTHGSMPSLCRINWDVTLHDGTSLLEPANTRMLDWLRRFVWSLFVARGEGAALSAGSLGMLSTPVSRFVKWMSENSVRWPKQLTPSTVDKYLDDLPEILANSEEDSAGSDDEAESNATEEQDGDGEDSGGIGKGVMRAHLRVVYLLWEQREELASCGIEPMPAAPWTKYKGVGQIVNQLATKVDGWIPPLPDEIAIPLLNKAFEMIGTPAEDVIRLHVEMDAAYASGTNLNMQRLRQKEAALTFAFSTIDGQEKPWLQPLLSNVKENGRGGVVEAVALVLDIRAACCLVVQGLTGLRVSELCGLKSGVDSVSGLPKCVEVIDSATGLNEVFVLRSDLSKTMKAPNTVPWLLGMRVKGSKELPATVRAFLVLERLLEPYRQLVGSDALLVGLSSGAGTPKSSHGVVKITSMQIRSSYRSFIADWVDLSTLPNESIHRTTPNDLVKWRDSKGRILKTHQMRKTFANYVLQSNPALLPAVKRQFQHISLAMTEGGYWGMDSAQLEPIESVSSQKTALMIYEVVSGRSRMGGKRGEDLEFELGELRTRLESMGISQGWREVVRWVEENDLRATHGLHGACIPIVGGEMQCHKKAGTRPILGSLRPQFMTREPSLCAGCECLALDSGHQPFWVQRYIVNEAAWREAKSRNDADRCKPIGARAEQARKTLIWIKTDVAALEASVIQEMKRHAEQEA